VRVKELFLVTVRLLKAAVFVASFLLWEKRTTAWFDFAFGVRSKQWLVGEPYQLPISDETIIEVVIAPLFWKKMFVPNEYTKITAHTRKTAFVPAILIS